MRLPNPRYGGRGTAGARGGGRLGLIVIAAIGIAIYWFSNQQTVPYTGRQQMITMSLADEVQLGAQSYAQILSGEQVLCGTRSASCSGDARDAVETVNEIGMRLAKAAIEYEQELVAQGLMTDTLADKFDWQFNVIASDQANAFCLPGGYVAVYTGILPVAANIDGLAVIMGHEIAHALARHGAERMSQQRLMQMGQMALAVGVSDMSPDTQQMIMGAFGAGAQFGVILPFSRDHESEADKIGFELLVRACYDPREAPDLWERMGALGGGQRQPEFMSTHPDPAQRAQNFRDWMPDAIALYEQRCGPLTGR
jgi:predicted Zn-dependent protease